MHCHQHYLSIMALDQIIKSSNIKGAIINKYVQIIAHADDVVIIATDMASRNSVFKKITQEAKKSGFKNIKKETGNDKQHRKKPKLKENNSCHI